MLAEYAKNPEAVKGRRQEESHPLVAQGQYAGILSMLRRNSNLDFSLYKETTVARRINRRMSFRQISDVSDYKTILAGDPEEVEALYKDLLIGVTEFFRDPEAFHFLGEKVVPELFSGFNRDEELRVWSPGCATGEEAYSLAILLSAKAEELGYPGKMMIFATDAHKASLDIASRGIYKRSALSNIPSSWVSRYFKMDGSDQVRVNDNLRKMIVFAPHNLLIDPPFTRINLISCRNLLIYLKASAQEKIISQFQFSLIKQGFLFLGKSESLNSLTEEFAEIDGQHKIFQKIRDPKPSLNMKNKYPEPAHAPAPGSVNQSMGLRNVTMDRRLLADYDALLRIYMPPGVLVDENFRILHVFGNVSDFLKPQEGRFQTSFINLVEDSLMVPVRTSFHMAEKTQQKAVLRNVKTCKGEEEIILDLSVTPLCDDKAMKAHYLVCFEILRKAEIMQSAGQEELPGYEAGVQFRKYVSGLEAELQVTQENLQATVEELQTSNEELQAANEELLASNEELQSTNEELHSLNEELYSVNAEFESKNEELKKLNTDHENLLASMDTGVIFLDSELRIRKFNPAMTSLFSLLPHDVGRPIDDLAYHLEDQKQLIEHVRQVLATGETVEKEEKTHDDRWLLPKIMPFRNEAGVIEGVVLTFVDITSIKEDEQRLKRLVRDLGESERRFSQLANSLPQLIWTCQPDGLCDFLSRQWVDYTGIPEEPQLGFGWLEQIHPDDRERTIATWNEAVASGTDFQDEFRIRGKDGSYRWFDTRAIRLHDSDGTVVKWFGSNTDISERRQAEDDLKIALAKYKTLFDSFPLGITVSDAAGNIIEMNVVAEKLLGVSTGEEMPREIGSSTWQVIRPDGTPMPTEEYPSMKALKEGRLMENVELGVVRQDGRVNWLNVTAAPMQLDGYGVVITYGDISSRKKAEDALRDSLEEKNALLKEVHHRVKNNLQIVASLLSLQAVRSKDSQVLDILEDTRGRVRSMAQLHETLYCSDNLAHINFASYLKDLCHQLLASSGFMAQRVKLDFRVAPVGLTLEPALPCGLIMNELVSNALKHGFPGGSTGTITIGLELNGDQTLVLSVQDNGTGLPPGFDPASRTTLGMRLVTGLVGQLNGQLLMERPPEGGTLFTVIFPLPEDSKIGGES